MVKAIVRNIVFVVVGSDSGGVDNDVGCLVMHFISVTHLIAAV